MFSYYGSKSKVVSAYPAPLFDRIIEPFAGSARYSLRYFEKDVILIDKYDVIVDVWKYLQQASPKDILSLPDVNKGDDIRLLGLSDSERNLIGFCINGGSTNPKNICAEFGSWNRDKKRIARELYKIRHWKIILGEYQSIDSCCQATWFVDPPYQFGGEWYEKPSNKIDYSKLKSWCESLSGQAIVCENTKANWMNFEPMKNLSGQLHTTTEAIWCNIPHIYQAKQLSFSDILGDRYE